MCHCASSPWGWGWSPGVLAAVLGQGVPRLLPWHCVPTDVPRGQRQLCLPARFSGALLKSQQSLPGGFPLSGGDSVLLQISICFKMWCCSSLEGTGPRFLVPLLSVQGQSCCGCSPRLPGLFSAKRQLWSWRSPRGRCLLPE